MLVGNDCSIWLSAVLSICLIPILYVHLVIRPKPLLLPYEEQISTFTPYATGEYKTLAVCFY